jgi:hypothetical protein
VDETVEESADSLSGVARYVTTDLLEPILVHCAGLEDTSGLKGKNVRLRVLGVHGLEKRRKRF